MKKAILLVAATCFGLLAMSPRAESQTQSYGYAYLRYLDGEATLQRASEPEPEAASLNVPILPGDRLWTHEGSRAEVRFADGTILRLSERTRVDFVDFDNERLVRIWSGSVILALSDAETAATYRVDSPAGTVYPAAAGRLRIDLHEGDALTLSVAEGVAELATTSGSVLVRSGQRSVVEPGRQPEAPFAFNTARWDEFDAWSDERDRYGRPAPQYLENLPGEVHSYVDDLGDYGEWTSDADHGYVWYPSVSTGWAPYRSGRWCYTSYGYTWASYEPWGWAPYHYGRWGYNHRGWYWIPGAYWSPAWVSWAIGPFWVGWSPLGYYDRPVFGYKSAFHYGGYYGSYYGKKHRGGRYGGPYYRGGKAVPRRVFENGAGWNFVDHRNLRSRAANVRLRADDLRPSSERARVLTNGAVLSRDLRPRAVGASAMTRSRALNRTVEAGGPRQAAGSRTRVRSRGAPQELSQQRSRGSAPQARSRSGNTSATRGTLTPSGNRIRNRTGGTIRNPAGIPRGSVVGRGGGTPRSLERVEGAPVLRRGGSSMTGQPPAAAPPSVRSRTGRSGTTRLGTTRSNATRGTVRGRTEGVRAPSGRGRGSRVTSPAPRRNRVSTPPPRGLGRQPSGRTTNTRAPARRRPSAGGSTVFGRSSGSRQLRSEPPAPPGRSSVRTPARRSRSTPSRRLERSRSRGQSFFNRPGSSRSSSRGRVARPSSPSPRSKSSRPSVRSRSSRGSRPSAAGGSRSRGGSRPKASGSRSRGGSRKSSSGSSRGGRARRRN